MDWLPVTILIPMHNEKQYIATCLDSVLANDYPRDRLEILIIDGMSDDGSREIVEQYIRQYPFIQLLDNPKKIQAAALNVGIQKAKGEIIIRMDAHNTYAPDYVRCCVELLLSTGAANVGGLQRAVGTHYVSEAIAITITNPFGIGDAHFRFAEKEMWVDTVYLGTSRRSTLEALGGFDEEWAVNEDYELNYRLRKAGGKILLSPKIRCWYYVRPSLWKLAIQYFRYGFWKVKTLVTYPDSLRWRQLASPTLVLALFICLCLFPVYWPTGVVVPALYLAASLTASIWTASLRGWKYLPLLPIIFATIHLSWGIGFLAGLFKWGIPRITLSSLVKAFQSPEVA